MAPRGTAKRRPKTRKLLTIYGKHHPKADVDRLYVPRKERRRGLMQLEATHAVEMTKLVEYIDSKENPLTEIVEHTNTTSTQLCYRKIDASKQKYKEKQEK
jgi:hypothetical protein